MKQILIICNTYYQLILAIQLRLTLFKNEIVDVMLSDTSVKSFEVYKRLKELHVFNNLKYFEQQSIIYNDNKWSKVVDILKYNFGSIRDIDIEKYDEVIFHNWTFHVFALLDYYEKIHHYPIWSRFEEGLFSYNVDYGTFKSNTRIWTTIKIRNLTKRKNLVGQVSKYYCIYPELRTAYPEWNSVTIPDFSTTAGELKRILNYIFDYHPIHDFRKFLYFSSMTVFDENKLVQEIANVVGKENLLVKVHPRNKTSFYQENDIKVMENSFVPWEIAQMNMDPSGTILLTANSGSFIGITAMMKSHARGYLLFNCVDCDVPFYLKRKQQMGLMLDKLHNMGLCDKISYNIHTIQELNSK